MFEFQKFQILDILNIHPCNYGCTLLKVDFQTNIFFTIFVEFLERDI